MIASSVFPCSKRTAPKLPRATTLRGSSSTARWNWARARPFCGRAAADNRARGAPGHRAVNFQRAAESSRTSSKRPCRDSHNPQVGMHQGRIGGVFQPRRETRVTASVVFAFLSKYPAQAYEGGYIGHCIFFTGDNGRPRRRAGLVDRERVPPRLNSGLTVGGERAKRT